MLLYPSLSCKELENIVKVVTRALNYAQKKVEGKSRNEPYAKEKVLRLGVLLFWKAKVRQLKGTPADKEVMQERRETQNIMAIYTVTDLKSYYGRQLSNAESIVEKSASQNRNIMRLHTKIMPKFQHHFSTGYGISKNFCRENLKLSSAG